MTRVLIAILPLLAAGQDFDGQRERMVRYQIEERGVKDPEVLKALRITPRHLFIPQQYRDSAYADHPVPIGHGQTISQPYIVGLMSDLLAVRKEHKVLEIGTGSGYQSAVLSPLAGQIYSIEIVAPLAEQARALLAQLGLKNITVRQGDGYKGWPEQAPFDRIILTAAPPEIPDALIAQLKPGGRLVAPVGRWDQDLVVLEKDEKGRVRQRSVLAVRFVPMVPGKG